MIHVPFLQKLKPNTDNVPIIKTEDKTVAPAAGMLNSAIPVPVLPWLSCPCGYPLGYPLG